MQRKSFLKLFLAAFGYMVLGNLMCTIMTVSLGAFIGSVFIQILAAVLSVFIFYALMFTAGYKDGMREQSLVRFKRVDAPVKNRWVTIGFALFGIMCIPCIVLFIDKISGFYFDFLLFFRFICGMIYPLSMVILPSASIDNMPEFMPFIFMLCYVFIPAVCQLGFHLGFTGKIDKDKIMYK